MKQSVQLKKNMEDLKARIRSLQAENRIDEAHQKLPEMQALQKEIDLAEALEAQEVENFAGEEIVARAGKVNPNAVLNKLIRGKRLTDEEAAYANENEMIFNAVGQPGQVEHIEEKGGVLVPEQQFNQLLELRRKYFALKDLCNVVPVTSFRGKMPTVSNETGMLIAFEELNEIPEGDITFGSIQYNVLDYGLIVPVSNTLLEDTNFNLMSFIGKNLARRGVNTENNIILTELNKLSATAVPDYLGVNKALNVTLDPAISAGASIVTNQTGFNYLDVLVDEHGRPMLKVSLQDETKKLYSGREIVVISDALLGNTATTKAPIFVGDFAEHLMFFDRKGVEVAVSEHAGFTKNATLLRAVQRFDVKVADPDAVVKLTIDTATAPAP